jgi:hypothetical protein
MMLHIIQMWLSPYYCHEEFGQHICASTPVNGRIRANLLEVFTILKAFDGIDEQLFIMRHYLIQDDILLNCIRI